MAMPSDFSGFPSGRASPLPCVILRAKHLSDASVCEICISILAEESVCRNHMWKEKESKHAVYFFSGTLKFPILHMPYFYGLLHSTTMLQTFITSMN